MNREEMDRLVAHLNAVGLELALLAISWGTSTPRGERAAQAARAIANLRDDIEQDLLGAE